MKGQISPEFKRAVESEVRRLVEQAGMLPVSPDVLGRLKAQLKAVKRQANTWSIGDVVDDVEKLGGQMIRNKAFSQDAPLIRRKLKALRGAPNPQSATQVINDLLLMLDKRG